MIHTLKTEQSFFEAILDGRKTFEVRYNDRGFQAGDTLRLREITPVYYTGRECMREITYVLSGYGLKEGYVALGLSLLQSVLDSAQGEGKSE